MTRVNIVAYNSIEQQFYVLIEEALNKASISEKQVLVSSVSEVQLTDLPAFFSYRENLFKGNRFFWSEPGRELSYVGLGTVYTIETNDSTDRFQRVHQEWEQLMKEAVVSDNVSGFCGPILFGGFSFDTEKAQSEMWSDFAHTSFVVPQFMLTVKKGRAWLTMNACVSPHESFDRSKYKFDFKHCKSLPPLAIESISEVYIEEIAPSDWIDAVRKATISIQNGQLEKVVLARTKRLQSEKAFESAKVLRRLLIDQQNTYVFAIERNDSCFIGATPERLIKRTGDQLLTLSLAGSIGRGVNPSEDENLGSFLSKDGKNLHEHMLAVHMIKGAMEELCLKVEATEAPIVFKLKDLQHLATPIHGQAKPTTTLLEAVEALHPTPALGGMPRIPAMHAIRELENMDRGWYAAPIGWLNKELDGEFAAGIRSGLLRNNIAYLFAGCGVVADSDPISEYHETALKFRPMLSALQALEVKA